MFQLYIEENFEVLPFYSGKYSDKNSNALSRLINSFIEAMNTKFYLPDYIIVLLDDDLIEYLQYKKFGIASLYGPWIEYLAQFLDQTIQERWEKLAPKARVSEKTQIYWVEPANHDTLSMLTSR